MFIKIKDNIGYNRLDKITKCSDVLFSVDYIKIESKGLEKDNFAYTTQKRLVLS